MQSLFTMRTLEDVVPAAHTLRPIREMANKTHKREKGFLILPATACMTSLFSRP
jgi:hypothetical protein